MRKLFGLVSILTASAIFINAQSQIATVTSSANFQLRGAGITPGQGVPSWPILAGDTLKAGTEVAVITFPDGSVLMLNPNSAATVDKVGGTSVFRLLSGSAGYSLKSLSSVQLLTTDKKVNVTSLTGSFSISGQRQMGFWTKGHTVAVLGVVAVGGATAAALGASSAAANSNGSQVSPSH